MRLETQVVKIGGQWQVGVKPPNGVWRWSVRFGNKRKPTKATIAEHRAQVLLVIKADIQAVIDWATKQLGDVE